MWTEPDAWLGRYEQDQDRCTNGSTVWRDRCVAFSCWSVVHMMMTASVVMNRQQLTTNFMLICSIVAVTSSMFDVSYRQSSVSTFNFTLIFEKQLTERNWTICQYISLNKCLSKIVSRVTLGCQYKFMAPIGLRQYEWVLRSGKIQRRTCWSFDKTAANKPSSRSATSWSTVESAWQ